MWRLAILLHVIIAPRSWRADVGGHAGSVASKRVGEVDLDRLPHWIRCLGADNCYRARANVEKFARS